MQGPVYDSTEILITINFPIYIPVRGLNVTLLTKIIFDETYDLTVCCNSVY